ncbi:hypothetical protein TYRP_009904 [Tyrophagus putrescentiae]|nr:hypothetical protein TYRP_009904 [Tyrophagus putrescentiae]
MTARIQALKALTRVNRLINLGLPQESTYEAMPVMTERKFLLFATLPVKLTRFTAAPPSSPRQMPAAPRSRSPAQKLRLPFTVLLIFS